MKVEIDEKMKFRKCTNMWKYVGQKNYKGNLDQIFLDE